MPGLHLSLLYLRLVSSGRIIDNFYACVCFYYYFYVMLRVSCLTIRGDTCLYVKEECRIISFQYEPIAATLTYEVTANEEQITLTVDLGGGTSDFTVIRRI